MVSKKYSDALQKLIKVRLGFEMGIKDCVLTKKEHVSFFISGCHFLSFTSKEKFVSFGAKMRCNCCCNTKPYVVFLVVLQLWSRSKKNFVLSLLIDKFK